MAHSFKGVAKSKLYNDKVVNGEYNMLARNVILFLAGLWVAYMALPDSNWILWIVAAIILIFSGFGIYGYFERRKNPSKHPFLKKFLIADNPQELFKTFEKELNDEKTHYDLDRSWYMTTNFLVNEGYFDVDWLHYSQAVWIYVKETQRIIYFIPAGSTYEIIMKFNTGKEIKISCNGEEDSQRMLAKIINWAPFAIYGFVPEIAAMWASDREQLYAVVSERLAQYHR